MRKIKLYQWMLLVVGVLFIAACVVNNQLVATIEQPAGQSAKYYDGQFHNASEAGESFSFSRLASIVKRRFNEERVDVEPAKPLPLKLITRAMLDDLSDDELHIAKLGHSSILLKVFGQYWLIDPMFSERASPFSFLGPKRFQSTPISIEDLPPIKKLLISHNHYDHLDKAAIEALANKTEQFLVPMGVEGDIEKWGIDADKIKRFDWWQEFRTDSALIAFTPTQHFSGRGLSDRNSTLWGSWVIKVGGYSLYFSGDSGYFEGFVDIGEKYGPFDLTMIETGAYNTNWGDVHMFPEESVQAHLELRGFNMLPIHNSTFDLSFHSWHEPLNRVSVAAEKHNVSLTLPIVGEFFTPKQAPISGKWWLDYQ